MDVLIKPNSFLNSADEINLIIDEEFSVQQFYPPEILKKNKPKKLTLKKIFGDEIYSEKLLPELKKAKKENLKSTIPFNGKNCEKDFLISIVPLGAFNGDGTKIQISVKANTKQNKPEDNYKNIFNSAILGIYQIDVVKNKFISVNPEVEKILGIENLGNCKEKQESLQLLNFNSGYRIELFKRLEADDEIKGCDSQLRIHDGRKIWISENIKAIKTEGKITQIVGTVKDITERQTAIQQLRLAKDDWERTFDTIEEVIIILDKELKIRRLNKAALREYNVFTDNPEGVFCNNLYHIGESHCSTCPARATIFDFKPHTQEVVYSSLGKTFLTSSLPIFDEQNEFVGVVFTAKNITEEKKLKKESEYRLQQVIQADKLKSLGELVTNVAHEINNPNSFIVQNTALLEKSWNMFYPIINDYMKIGSVDDYDRTYYKDLADEMEELIQSVKLGSKRISDFVSNLKDFAKTDDEEFRFVEINSVIKKSFQIFESKIKKSFRYIDLQLENDIPEIYADFQKLEQVIINIIVNAIQAITNKNESKLRIKTKFVERLSAVYIEIQDNGKGIPKDIIPRLFEPFFTTKRDEGGTGLGLSISNEIIEKHSGVMDVHSEFGAGTTFKIYIPIKENELGKFSSKILCVDQGNSIFNEDVVCFLGEGPDPMRRLNDTVKISKYLESHPEVNVILINHKMCEDTECLKNILTSLQQLNPLLNIILFGMEDELFIDESVKLNGTKVVYSSNEKILISEINKLLSHHI